MNAAGAVRLRRSPVTAQRPCTQCPATSRTHPPVQVIKGCWQLDGKHHGDPVTDRTAGAAAIEDMELFVRAGALGRGGRDGRLPSAGARGVRSLRVHRRRSVPLTARTPLPNARPTGVTAFDTSDSFGPSEALIGQFRSLSPRVADDVTLLTKLTFMGSPGAGATSREMVE